LNHGAPPLIVGGMSRINVVAVVIAFLTELGVDLIRSDVVMLILGYSAFKPGLSDDEAQKIAEAIGNGAPYLTASVLLGTATTIGGGYFAARLAKTYPYYNGLAIGLICLAEGLYFWQMGPLWLSLFSALTVIPASIFGAHLAKPHLPAPE